MTYRTRFAPSPTGYLHLGHGFSARTAFEAALAHGGQFILRIEDIDHTRARPLFEAAIFEDLQRLGLQWEDPVLKQSTRTAAYQEALDHLKALKLVYPCFKSRKTLAQEALSAPQDNETVRKNLGEPLSTEEHSSQSPPAWRLDLNAAKARLGPNYEHLGFFDLYQGWTKATPEINGDVILGRKDIGFAYHLAVVVDDAFQNITHIHRGLDLWEATHTHVLLQTLLGLPSPIYAHHRLILDAEGQRLAKRKGSLALRDYLNQGLSLSDLRALWS